MRVCTLVFATSLLMSLDVHAVPSPAVLTGRVHRGGKPATAMIALHRLPPDADSDGELLAYVETDEDGRFRLPAAAGHYELAIFEVLDHGQRDRRIRVAVGPSTRALDIDLAWPSQLTVELPRELTHERGNDWVLLFPGRLSRPRAHDGGAYIKRAYMAHARPTVTFRELKSGTYTLQTELGIRHVKVPERGVAHVALDGGTESPDAMEFEPARPSDYSPQEKLRLY